MNHSFKDLKAWQKAMDIADAIYHLSWTRQDSLATSD